MEKGFKIPPPPPGFFSDEDDCRDRKLVARPGRKVGKKDDELFVIHCIKHPGL